MKALVAKAKELSQKQKEGIIKITYYIKKSNDYNKLEDALRKSLREVGIIISKRKLIELIRSKKPIKPPSKPVLSPKEHELLEKFSPEQGWGPEKYKKL